MKCASGTAGAGTSPWPCWPRPFWRWLGIRRPRGDRVKRGLPRRGGRADTDDGARGAPIALPAGLDALPPGGFGVGLVSVETPTSGQSPALSLSTPPQTSGIICATVVLRPAACSAAAAGEAETPTPIRFGLSCGLRLAGWLEPRLHERLTAVLLLKSTFFTMVRTTTAASFAGSPCRCPRC